MNTEDLVIIPSAKTFKFHKIITFDTEAYRFGNEFNQNDLRYREKQIFFNFGMYDGNESLYSEKIEDFLIDVDYLLKKYKKITLINLNAKYDYPILHLLDSFITNKKLLGLDLKRLILGSVNFIKFSSKNHKYSIQFLDSYNYFKTSLKQLGKTLNKNNSEYNEELEKINEEEYKLDWESWNKQLLVTGKQRVLRDCKILYEFFTEFIKMPNVVFGISSASTSFKTFKSKWLKQIITFPKKLIEPALLSYRGGRVEAYTIYDEPQNENYYDINSLYPYVMSKYKYSVKFHKQIFKLDLEKIARGNYNYLIKLNYTYQDRPKRLPILIKSNDGKLIQSYSGKDVWLTGNEVLELSKGNVLIEFLEGYEFINAPIFKDYVEYYYKLRQQTNNEVWNMFYKTGMLNSLYGKFGQHKRITEYLGYNDLDDLQKMALEISQKNNKDRFILNGYMYSVYGEFITKLKELPLEQYANPLIASEVTANARLENWYKQLQIGIENVDYTDTDSFMTKTVIAESKQLGDVKLESKGLFQFYDVKDYTFYGICKHKDCLICHYPYCDVTTKEIKYMTGEGLHTTLKGIRKDAIQISENEYIQKQFTGIKSGDNHSVTVYNVSKELKRKRSKLRYVRDTDRDIGLPYYTQNTDFQVEITEKT